MSLLDLANKIKGFIQTSTPFANPTSNNGNNFWGNQGGQNLVKAQQFTQPAVSNLNAWGNIAKQGINNQVNIQKQAFAPGGMYNNAYQTIKQNPVLTPSFNRFEAAAPALIRQINPLKPQTPQQNWQDSKKVGAAALTAYGMAKAPISAILGSAAISPIVKIGTNIYNKKPVSEGVVDSVSEGAGIGLANAGTTRLTNFLVQSLSGAIPILKPLTEKAISQSAPMASDTLKQGIKKLLNTAGKRFIKAAVIETAVESPIWATFTQKEQESYVQALTREVGENLIMNIGMAGVQTLGDAKSLAPIIGRTVKDIVNNAFTNPDGSLKMRSGKTTLLTQGKTNIKIKSNQAEPVRIGQLGQPNLQSDQPVISKTNIELPNKTKTIENPILQTSQDILPKERGFVTSVKEAQDISEPVKIDTQGTYLPKPNEKLMGEAKALLSEGATIDFKNTQGLDKKVAATIQEAINLDKTGDHEAAANLYNNLSTHATELGRGVQAFSLLDRMSPESIALSASGKIKKYNLTATRQIPELNGDQVKMISEKVKAIDTLTGRDKNIAINELSNIINDFIPSSLADKAITVWKAGLLTSLRTHERNLLGNAIHGGAEVAKDIIASPTDWLMSQKTGKRTTTFTTKGLGEFGAKSTQQQVADIVSKGYDPSETISKFDHKRINWGNNPVEQILKKYTDTVFRVLGAADKPYYNAAYARSLYDQAGAEAINIGQRGSKEFIEKLVLNPTEQMLKTAISDANVATFHNKNMASSVATALKNGLSKNELGKVVAEVAMPFTGVPSAIAGQTIAYSPIGLIKGAVDVGRVLMSDIPNLQRQAAQEVGRGVIGTGLFALGAYLMSRGIMTGQPKDVNESALWQAQGKQANSVLIGGKWRSINSIGPENIVILAGAKLKEEMSNPDASLGAYAFGIGKDQLNQTFLAGVQGPLNAITDPNRYGKSYIGNQTASIIPNIVKDASKAFDPSARENNTIQDYMKSGIPGARNTLLPKRDNFGNITPQEPTGVGAFFDLFNSKTPIDNATINEITRLYNTGNDALPSKLSPSQTIQKMKVKLTPEQLNSFEAQAGPIIKEKINQLIQSPNYQKLSDEKKAKAIQDITSTVRTQIKNTLDLKTLSAGTFETSADAPKNALQTIKVYGEGIFKDPKAVISAVSSGQPVRKIRGDAVILERAQSLGAIDKGDTTTQVDHIIPLSLGGSNNQDNLQVVSTNENQAKAVVEVYLGDLLAKGTINKKEAQDRILNWRAEVTKMPSNYKNKANAILSKPAELTVQKVDESKLQNIGQTYQIVDDKGNVSDIDLTMPERPALTGQAELDKLLKSKFSGQLTTLKNNIVKLNLDGQLTAQEANNAIIAINNLKLKSGSGSGGTGKGKKAPKIAIAKVSAPKKIAGIKISKFTPKKITIARLPTFKSSKTKAYKNIKITASKKQSPSKKIAFKITKKGSLTA